MSKKIKNDTWLWVIIQNPGKNESFLGIEDEKNQIKFIPVFFEKDSALRCEALLPKDESLDYEPQAILYDELMEYVSKNGFMIFILNKKGEILDRIAPC